MADSFEQVIQDLFGAMETISKSVTDSMEFDKTIQAEIVDVKDADKGTYICSDGSSKFKAYSENTSYREGDWVYVSIPKGDFNKQKLITGKRMKEEDDYYNYIAALERHIDITGNLIHEAQEQYELVANGPETQITIWENANFPNGVGYTKLGLRGEFKTWLSALKADKGSYGLRVDIIGQEMNTTQTKPENKFYTFKLDCSEFYGNPYNFETFYEQEASFDISQIDKIISIRLVFYQDGNFINDKGVNLASSYENGTSVEPNIFMCNPYLSLGYDFDENSDDTVILYTLNSKTYTSFMNPDVKLETFINEVGLTDDQKKFLENTLNRLAKIESYFSDNARERTQARENYDSGLITQKDYNDILSALNEKKYEDKTQEDLNKEVTALNQSIQDLYNNYDFNNDELLKHYCNKMNLKTLQVRWIHKEDNGIMRSIDSVEDMPKGSKIHWYKYNVSNGISDKLAGPFWEEFKPNGKDNSFVYINFSPNFDLATEQFKVIIEDSSEEFIEKEIKNSPEIQIIQKKLELELDEEERTKLIDDLNNLVSEYRERINYYESEILTFSNEDKSSSELAADLISNLEIECDIENQKGIYNLYTQNGNIIAQAEATKKRILTARYNTLITGQDLFDTAEKITWRIPTVNTMIEEPIKGSEYEDYSLRILISADEFKAGTYYSKDANNTYTLIDPANHTFSMQNTYYVKNNLEIIRNEEKGYVDIVRYGIVSSRVPGTEEADTTEQYFRIKPQYSQNLTNNTIHCIISKNNKEYTASYELAFGAVGTNGTDYTFTLKFDESAPAMTWADDNQKDKRKGLIVKPCICDYEQKDITSEVGNITYSWYSFGSGGMTLSPEGKNCKIDFTEINTAKKSTQLADCKHYILMAKATVNVAFVEKKVDANLNPNNKTETQDNIETPQARDVELTAYISIPVRNISRTTWTQFSGTDKICYDVNGTNAVYYQGKQSLFYYDANQKKTIQDTSIQWSVDLGSDTTYPTADANNKRKILKYYPMINAEGQVVATSLYVQDNGKQISILGKKDGDIQWIQPIRVYQDAYSAVGLNSWDGSLTIDKDNGKIMSAMIGAGKKDSQNRFEGILMGDVTLAGVNEGNLSAEEGSTAKELSKYYNGTGLYGYNQGVKSFGLNINGKAFFGKPGSGQILIDGNSSTIQSRRYMETKGNVGKEKVVYQNNGTIAPIRKDAFKGLENGIDVSGMIIDLDDGYLKTYGEGTASSVVIDPGAAGSYPFFEVKSDKGKPLLHAGRSNYYLQSDNYVTENDDYYDVNNKTDATKLGLGAGLKLDLKNGSLNAYNFKLKATNGSGNRYSGSYIEMNSNGTPYFKIFYKDSQSTSTLSQDGQEIVNINNTQLTLRSQNWDGSTKGTQLDFGSSGSGITSYDFSLMAKNNTAGNRYQGSYLQIKSNGSPYLRVHHTDSENKRDLNVVNITNTDFQLRSHNYNSTDKTGTYINMNTGDITIGEYFSVKGSNGAITAKSGTIGGWEINENFLRSPNGSVTLRSTLSDSYPYAISVYNNDARDTRVFSVSRYGNLYSVAGDIGSWKITSSSLQSSATNPDIFLAPAGKDDISLLGAKRDNIVFKAGSNFGVNSSGKLYTKSALIDDATITDTCDIAKVNIDKLYYNGSYISMNTIQVVTSVGLTSEKAFSTPFIATLSATKSAPLGNRIKSISWSEGTLTVRKPILNYNYKTIRVLTSVDGSEKTSSDGVLGGAANIVNKNVTASGGDD